MAYNQKIIHHGLMEMIVYLISLLVMFITIKRLITGSHRTEDGAKDELTQFLEALNEDEVHVQKKAPPPPLPKKKKNKLPPPVVKIAPVGSQASFDERFSGQNVVSRHFQELANATPTEVIKPKASKVERLLRSLKSKQQMIIYSEVIGKPKGSRM